MEEAKVRAWLEWESRTEALRGISDDIAEALQAMVAHLPEDYVELGSHVQFLGRAAIESRDFGSGLGVPNEPNSYRGLRFRDRSHSVVGPKAALAGLKAALRDNPWEEPAPLAARVKQGAALTPIKPGSD